MAAKNPSDLQTFHLPESINGTEAEVHLARRMMRAWQADGIFQVATDPVQNRRTTAAMEASRRFFAEPLEFKSRHVSDLTYSGYIASGAELTAGEADYSEIFTVCPDVPLADPRVRAQWPCHGPVPWPGGAYQQSMRTFMGELGSIGEKLLKLTALGLGLGDLDTLTRLTNGGWHHMRVLRFPARSQQTSRGIGAHTDYGLLVIAAQDDVGGLYIRPPVDGEWRPRNWLETESAAGRYENEEPWTYVRPVPNVALRTWLEPVTARSPPARDRPDRSARRLATTSALTCVDVSRFGDRAPVGRPLFVSGWLRLPAGCEEPPMY